MDSVKNEKGDVIIGFVDMEKVVRGYCKNNFNYFCK